MNGPLKFRKKPVVIEAMRFVDAASASAIQQWSASTQRHQLGSPVSYHPNGAGLDPGPPVLVVKTLEGNHLATLGDWIIRGVAGEFYPCKPEIFDKTYEPVPNDMPVFRRPLPDNP